MKSLLVAKIYFTYLFKYIPDQDIRFYKDLYKFLQAHPQEVLMHGRALLHKLLLEKEKFPLHFVYTLSFAYALSSLVRYQTLLYLCGLACALHGKQIAHLITTSSIELDVLEKIYLQHPDIIHIHTLQRAQLIYGFQWYKGAIRREITYQRIIQEVLTRAHILGCTYD